MEKLQRITTLLGGAAVIAVLLLASLVVASQPLSANEDEAIEIDPCFPEMVHVLGVVESIENDTVLLKVNDSSVAGLDATTFLTSDLSPGLDINVGDQIEISFERAQLDASLVRPVWVKTRDGVFYSELKDQSSEVH